MDFITAETVRDWTSNYIKQTLGEKVKSVSLSLDKEYMTLRLESGVTHKFKVEGDCCSHSWIEHLEVPNDIEGATIMAWGEKEPIDHIENDEYECLQVYETRIRTNRGDVVLEFRNSSNGYYGGYLVYEGSTQPANDNGRA